MMELRVVLAVFAILGLIALEMVLLIAFPHFMQVFRDMEVTDFPAIAVAAITVSNALHTHPYVTIPVTVLVAVGLIALALSRRVSSKVSIAALLSIIVVAGVAAGLSILGVFLTMVRLIEGLMNKG
jgi:hypothetical protein